MGFKTTTKIEAEQEITHAYTAIILVRIRSLPKAWFIRTPFRHIINFSFSLWIYFLPRFIIRLFCAFFHFSFMMCPIWKHPFFMLFILFVNLWLSIILSVSNLIYFILKLIHRFVYTHGLCWAWSSLVKSIWSLNAHTNKN